MFSYSVTHVFFEELQPLVVFTFGFPHFDQRLNLRKKIYLCQHDTYETGTLEKGFITFTTEATFF